MNDKKAILMGNLASYKSANLPYGFSEEDFDYLISLNLEVILRLEQLLGDRFQAIGLPSFLMNEGNSVNAYCIRIEQIVTHASHSDRAEAIANQIAGVCIEDSSLVLFMHTPVLPGGLLENYERKFDRTKWRSRYLIKQGTLFTPQAIKTITEPVLVNRPRPPGFGLDFNQIMEGTSPAED